MLEKIWAGFVNEVICILVTHRIAVLTLATYHEENNQDNICDGHSEHEHQNYENET